MKAVSLIKRNHSIINLTVSQYKGTKVLDDGENIPGVDFERLNKRVVQLGSKKLFDPKLLAPGEKLKARAESLAEKWGVKHPYRRGLSYILENSKLDAVLQELESIEQEFWDWVNFQFTEPRYSEAVQKWAEENPDLKEVILGLAPSAREAYNSFGWIVSVDALAPSIGENEPERVREAKEKTSNKVVSSLEDRLLSEIAAIAKETLAKSIDGKSRITRRALSPARRAVEKLEALSMVTPYAKPLAGHITKVIDPIAQGRGKLESHEVAAIVSLYQMLAVPEQVKTLFKGMASVVQNDEDSGLSEDEVSDDTNSEDKPVEEHASSESDSSQGDSQKDEGDKDKANSGNILDLVL